MTPSTPPAPAKIFVSYASDQTDAVAKVCHCLARQAAVDVYFFPDQVQSGNFPPQLFDAIRESSYFICFLSAGSEASGWQATELVEWMQRRGRAPNNRGLVVVSVDGSQAYPPGAEVRLRDVHRLSEAMTPTLDEWAPRIALKILNALKIDDAPFDDLPVFLQARYEKEIIKDYLANGDGTVRPELVADGYPASWPDVPRHFQDDGAPDWSWIDNPLDEDTHGSFRSDSAAVLVDARVGTANGNRSRSERAGARLEARVKHARGESGVIARALTFPEAGPRERILHTGALKAGVLVSGGIAPGINAVISGILTPPAWW